MGARIDTSKWCYHISTMTKLARLAAQNAELGKQLTENADLRWVAAHVQHYRPTNLNPTYWPGMNAERLVQLDAALSAGIVAHETFASGHSYFEVTDLGGRAIRAAVKAGAR